MDNETSNQILIDEEENKQEEYTSNSCPSKNISLTEPIKTTILRDLALISSKLTFFYKFKNNKKNNFAEHEIKNYELWGPFIFTLIFAVSNTLHSQNMEDDFSLIILFQIISFFGLIINSKLLKIRISYLEGLSIFGYLIFPLSFVALVNSILYFLPCFLRFLIITLGFFGSLKSGKDIFENLCGEDKVFLTLFPILLWQLAMAWFVFFA